MLIDFGNEFNEHTDSELFLKKVTGEGEEGGINSRSTSLHKAYLQGGPILFWGLLLSTLYIVDKEIP